MLRTKSLSFLVLPVFAALWFSGCEKTPATSDKTVAPAATDATAENAPPIDEAKIAEALAQLSPEDRKAAEQQRVCPVSDARLGTMDKPFKVSVNGKDVFLCCEGCEPDLKKDPDKYLAKLKK